MSDRHPIRSTAIGTVVAGVILAALGQMWPAARRVLGWLLGLLTSAIAVPVWVVLLVIVGIVVGMAASAKRTSEPEVMPARVPDTIDEDITLPALERDVLARLARDDGAPVGLDTLKRSLGVSNLELRAAVDRLEALELVEVDEAEEVWLTGRGRRYVVDNRLAR